MFGLTLHLDHFLMVRKHKRHPVVPFVSFLPNQWADHAVLVAFLTASTVCFVAAVKLVCAVSTACCADACAVLNAFWLALMAWLKKAMADSEPAGAPLVALSIRVAKPFCTSAMLAWAALVNSALA